MKAFEIGGDTVYKLYGDELTTVFDALSDAAYAAEQDDRPKRRAEYVRLMQEFEATCS